LSSLPPGRAYRQAEKRLRRKLQVLESLGVSDGFLVENRGYAAAAHFFLASGACVISDANGVC
jgi:hypothetical protein